MENLEIKLNYILEELKKSYPFLNQSYLSNISNKDKYIFELTNILKNNCELLERDNVLSLFDSQKNLELYEFSNFETIINYDTNGSIRLEYKEIPFGAINVKSSLCRKKTIYDNNI